MGWLLHAGREIWPLRSNAVISLHFIQINLFKSIYFFGQWWFTAAGTEARGHCENLHPQSCRGCFHSHVTF